jgi:hypothetical protein
MFEFRAPSSGPPPAQDADQQSKADAAHIQGAEATLLIPPCPPMQPTLVKQPFHRPGWVYEEKVDGWRMLAYVTGFAHSILGGSAWQPTAQRAVQRARWDALEHAERNP